MRWATAALMHLGTLVVVLGLGKVHAQFIGHYDYTGSSRLAWSLAYSAILSLAAYGAGFPDLLAGRSRFAAAGVATGAAALVVSIVQLAAGSALLPRFVVFSSALVLLLWYSTSATVARGRRERGATRARVVAVVTDEEGGELHRDLAATPEKPAMLVTTMRVEEAVDVAGDSPLIRVAEATNANVVVLDRHAQTEDSIVAQAARLHERGTRVRTLTLFYDEWLGKMPIEELERMSLMFDIGEIHRVHYGRVKRVIDLILALVGCGLLALLIPIVVLGDLFANRGPLLYRQLRVGRNGGTFEILKFRTMRPAPEGPIDEWTVHDDPRVTPFGGLLRRMHLDELPQVVNILRGDLAVVGPRPEQPHYVDELVTKIPFYDVRHLVRPGLTGWAQVKYGYAGDERDAIQKLQYEFYYLRHQDLVFDLRILGRTLRAVFGMQGR